MPSTRVNSLSSLLLSHRERAFTAFPLLPLLLLSHLTPHMAFGAVQPGRSRPFSSGRMSYRVTGGDNLLRLLPLPSSTAPRRLDGVDEMDGLVPIPAEVPSLYATHRPSTTTPNTPSADPRPQYDCLDMDQLREALVEEIRAELARDMKRHDTLLAGLGVTILVLTTILLFLITRYCAVMRSHHRVTPRKGMCEVPSSGESEVFRV